MPLVSLPGHATSEFAGLLDWDSFRATGVMRHKITNEPIWIDRDRRVYLLHEIPDQHLQHIERWLLGYGAEDVPARKSAYDAGWYDIIRDELERRSLETLPQHYSLDPGNRDFAFGNEPQEPSEREKFWAEIGIDSP